MKKILFALIAALIMISVAVLPANGTLSSSVTSENNEIKYEGAAGDIVVPPETDAQGNIVEPPVEIVPVPGKENEAVIKGKDNPDGFINSPDKTKPVDAKVKIPANKKFCLFFQLENKGANIAGYVVTIDFGDNNPLVGIVNISKQGTYITGEFGTGTALIDVPSQGGMKLLPFFKSYKSIPPVKSMKESPGIIDIHIEKSNQNRNVMVKIIFDETPLP